MSGTRRLDRALSTRRPRRIFGLQEAPMSDDVQIYIEGQRAVSRQLSARGLPTSTQAGILRKLISERNAAIADERIRLYARKTPANRRSFRRAPHAAAA